MDNTRKVLPFINPSGTPIHTSCELCASEISPKHGYPVVFNGKIEGYVCDECFVSSEQNKPNVKLQFVER